MSDSGSKTEQATPRRREDARKDGQVARSEDLTNVVLFGLFFSYLVIDGARLGSEMVQLILLPYPYLDQPFVTAAETVITLLLSKALLLVFSILIASAMMSCLIQLIQIGPLFSTKSITPSLKKLNVIKNIKEIFSVNTLVDLGKMVIKTGLMCFVIYLVLVGNLRMLLQLSRYDLPGILVAEGQLFKDLTITIFFLFSFLALFDFFWQRHRLAKQLMMQKHEVKREHKDNEGDPQTKEVRRNLFREIVSGDIERIPRAAVVIANPTHLAVALYYKPPQTGLPIILVKGSGQGAERIFKAARDAGVPIIQNISVARHLFPMDIYASIPNELIDAVAEIIIAARQIQRAAYGDDMAPYMFDENIQNDIKAETVQSDLPSSKPPDRAAFHTNVLPPNQR